MGEKNGEEVIRKHFDSHLIIKRNYKPNLTPMKRDKVVKTVQWGPVP